VTGWIAGVRDYRSSAGAEKEDEEDDRRVALAGLVAIRVRVVGVIAKVTVSVPPTDMPEGGMSSPMSIFSARSSTAPDPFPARPEGPQFGPAQRRLGRSHASFKPRV
jgi:hypothetical protein